jgi:polygalacturonase
MAKSNQTIYIEGGAIVLGAIYIQDAENVTIAGHGIMDDYHSFQDPSCWGMRLYRCKNTTVKDILLANMHGWTTYAVECEDVTFDNYKVVAAWNEHNNTGVENDGMGVMCGKRIKFLNTFSYSHDDTYVIKSGKWSYKGEVEDVLYDGCMAWNRWGGNAFEIGYEVPYNISNIRYRNCYVLRSAISIGYTFRHGAMAIHNSGKGTVSNVSYENMHIDNPDEFGIYFSIIKSSYTLPDGEVWGPGNINGVTMKNIFMYNTPPYGNILFGYDKDHTVKNISIENLVIDGKKCMSIKDANFTVDQAHAKVSYPVPDSEVTFK